MGNLCGINEQQDFQASWLLLKSLSQEKLGMENERRRVNMQTISGYKQAIYMYVSFLYKILISYCPRVNQVAKGGAGT